MDLDYNHRIADLYIVPNIRIEQFLNNPLVSLPIAWNQLGDKPCFRHNRTAFKIPLPNHVFEQLLAAKVPIHVGVQVGFIAFVIINSSLFLHFYSLPLCVPSPCHLPALLARLGLAAPPPFL